MKKSLTTLFMLGFTLWLGLASPMTVLAQTPPSRDARAAAGGADDIFGTIEAPAGVAAYNAQAGESGLGIMIFFSNVVRLITIVAGIWVFVNFLLAGLSFVTAAGDSGATKKVYDRISMSVIGLVIIASSYTLAGMASLLLFGRADFILNPSLIGVT